jgi:hypothetical protein
MTLTFYRDVSSHGDVKQLEFIIALLQSNPEQVLLDGRFRLIDLARFLKSRFGLRDIPLTVSRSPAKDKETVSFEYLYRRLIHELGGDVRNFARPGENGATPTTLVGTLSGSFKADKAANESEFFYSQETTMDMVQVASILMIPYFVGLVKQIQEDDPPLSTDVSAFSKLNYSISGTSSSASMPVRTARKLLKATVDDVLRDQFPVDDNTGQPIITIDTVREVLMAVVGESENLDEALIEEMVEVATRNQSTMSILQSPFVVALTSDVVDNYHPMWDELLTTCYDDVTSMEVVSKEANNNGEIDDNAETNHSRRMTLEKLRSQRNIPQRPSKRQADTKSSMDPSDSQIQQLRRQKTAASVDSIADTQRRPYFTVLLWCVRVLVDARNVLCLSHTHVS